MKHIATGTAFGSVVLVPSFSASDRWAGRLVLAWFVLGAGCIGYLGWRLGKLMAGQRGRAEIVPLLWWAVPTLILGPLGLLAFHLSGRWPMCRSAAEPSRNSLWRRAAGSVAISLSAATVGVVVGITALMSGSSNPGLGVQLALNFGLPLIATAVLWLVLRRLGVARQPLIAAFVSSSSALAGIDLVWVILTDR